MIFLFYSGILFEIKHKDVKRFIQITTQLAFLSFLALTGCGDNSTQNCGDLETSGYLFSKTDCRILSWSIYNLPIRLTKDASLTTETSSVLGEALDQAIEIWETNTHINLFDVIPSSDVTYASIDFRRNLIAMRQGETWTQDPILGKNTEPGKTVYYSNGEYLINTNIFFNEEFIDGSKGNYDLLSIALHELGHTLGLDHDNNDEPNISIMKYNLEPGEKRQLTERDIMRVRALYDPT